MLMPLIYIYVYSPKRTLLDEVDIISKYELDNIMPSCQHLLV